MKPILAKIKQNHAMMMIICCGIPMLGMLTLSSLGILGSWGYFALILICPLGHILMRRGIHSNSKKNMVPRQIGYKDYDS